VNAFFRFVIMEIFIHNFIYSCKVFGTSSQPETRLKIANDAPLTRRPPAIKNDSSAILAARFSRFFAVPPATLRPLGKRALRIRAMEGGKRALLQRASYESVMKSIFTLQRVRESNPVSPFHESARFRWKLARIRVLDATAENGRFAGFTQPNAV